MSPGGRLAFYLHLQTGFPSGAVSGSRLLIKAGGVAELTEQHIVDGHLQVWRYRYALRLPLRADTHPLYVNWCEVTITTPDGALLYHNAWPPIIHSPPACTPWSLPPPRWKSENENNNVLKNYGYHLEHNFGHGDQYWPWC